MKNKQKRIIKFIHKLTKEDLKNIGIYKIINTINNHFYIGSSERKFNERFKEHCRYYEQWKEGTKKCMHPILWQAYDKYGIENFKVEILEVLNNKTHEEILKCEEYYILNLNPEYNICKYPTNGGKPNLGKKLTDEWKANITKKSSEYKHSEETLKIVSNNNKINASKIELIKDSESLCFNSWVEVAKYFNVSSSAIQNAYKRTGKFREYTINKLTKQSKSIKVFIEDNFIIFNSFNECDKYFNMWRGYTSTLISSKANKLIINKYKFEIL